MEFFLRDARQEDFEALWNLDQKCFPPEISYSPAELAAYMRRRGSFTIVTEQVFAKVKTSSRRAMTGPQKIIGFVVAENSRRNVGHIITIDVLPEVRRFGVGSKLLSAAEDRLTGTQCCRVMLEVAVDNRAALSFYKRHKYMLVKTVPRYYSNGVDALVLQKDLLSQGTND